MKVNLTLTLTGTVQLSELPIAAPLPPVVVHGAGGTFSQAVDVAVYNLSRTLSRQEGP